MGQRNISFTGWQHKAQRIEGHGPSNGGLVLQIPPGFVMSAIGIAAEAERLRYELGDEDQLRALARLHPNFLRSRNLKRVYGFGGTSFVVGGDPAEIDVPYLQIEHGVRGITAKVEVDRIKDGHERIFNGAEGRDFGFLILEPLGSLIDLACHGCA